MSATCREVITFLLQYLSDELPPEKVIEFEEHLAVCPSCVAYLRSYRESVRVARAAFELAPLQAGDTEALVSVIMAALGRSNG
jgi:anti-sigma factor RsiW